MRAGHLLTAKFIVAYLPSFGLGLVFLLAIALAQKMVFAAFLYSFLAMGMCLAGMNGILLGFGTIGANFNWNDPRKMNAGKLGCLGQIITAVFLPITFGLFIGPLWLVSFFHWPIFYGYLVGGIMGVAVNVVGTILPSWLVRKRVERLGEY